MITAAVLRKRIEDVSLQLVEHGVALALSVPRVLATEDGELVTWSSYAPLSETFGQFGTVGEYRDHVQAQSYNVMLRDGAFLQLSYTVAHGTIIAHRLCFFPCPIVFSEDEAETLGIDELLDAISTEWQERVRLRTPIRFDYAPKAACEDHPATHLTLCEEHCRIAVSSPLSVGHFFRFVFRNFYPDLWTSHSFLREVTMDQLPSCMSEIDADTLFVSWRRPA